MTKRKSKRKMREWWVLEIYPYGISKLPTLLTFTSEQAAKDCANSGEKVIKVCEVRR